ncbi:MAG: cupin domain-containing protein [Acidithiobacillus ferrivorans]
MNYGATQRLVPVLNRRSLHKILAPHRLVTDIGETQLHPGMCAGFKAGMGDGHQLVNRSSEDVVYLEIGDRTAGDSASYPDDDLQSILVNGNWQFNHKDGTPY